jgi:pyrroline-5-carboxylate reductase
VKATVFLGGGRIATALIAGLRLANYRTPIIVHDRNPHKLRALKREFHVIVESDLGRAVALAKLLIIAVRPGDVAAILQAASKVASVNRRPSQPAWIACSLAAGIPLAKLRMMGGPPFLWTRAMPSPVCRTGRGLTAIAFDRGVPRAARTRVRQFFAQVGTVLEVPESRFDAFTVTYSASHGYHALAALASTAQKLGLDRKTAYTAAAHALADGIVAWREQKTSLDALLREAATPGGIAATVMNTMDADAYSQVIEAGLRAGIARARKNAKS